MCSYEWQQKLAFHKNEKYDSAAKALTFQIPMQEDMGIYHKCQSIFLQRRNIICNIDQQDISVLTETHSYIPQRCMYSGNRYFAIGFIFLLCFPFIHKTI